MRTIHCIRAALHKSFRPESKQKFELDCCTAQKRKRKGACKETCKTRRRVGRRVQITVARIILGVSVADFSANPSVLRFPRASDLSRLGRGSLRPCSPRYGC